VAVKSSPLDSIFQTLREIARDTARRLGKDVRLHLAGEGAGWEGNDLSRLQEALVQVLQNAIDHGIEASDAREKIGKSRTGQIWVEFSEGNAESVVTVRDDGAGVDVAAVHRKAVGLGLVASPSALAAEDTLALLFQPGFSTKKTVTEVSGRGIGLDIVQSVADSFSGKVEIDTTRGKGTTLILRFPRKTRATAA
jgi:two-component system chemotaxis sensor kinase CheA